MQHGLGDEGEVGCHGGAGETLPKIIDTGFYYYDKTNIDDPTIAAVLYD